MADKEENAASAEVSAEDLQQLFAPSWARSGVDSTTKIVGGRRPSFDRDGEDRRGDRRDGPRDAFRKPRGEGRPEGRREDRRDDRRNGARREDKPRFEESPKRIPPPDVAVRFMPETRALESVIRRIQNTHLAYPFRDIVKLFQRDDKSMVVRIESRDQGNPLFQCRKCGMPGLTADDITEHLFKEHWNDFFDCEEIEVDPPSGNFPCIAKCGLTGELLGPPNHHSFAARVREIVAERFPGMGEEEYRRHIEMVRDPEVVEQWKQSCRKRKVFFLKEEAPAKQPEAKKEAEAEQPAPAEGGAQPAEGEAAQPTEPAPEAKPERKALDRTEAESLFRREILIKNIASATHVVAPAKSLQKLADRRLASFLSACFADEENPTYRNGAEGTSRRGGTLFVAIHAAFHHRGLSFFRAVDERGQEFVTAVKPVSFNEANVTPEIAAILKFVSEHPSTPYKALVDELVPDGNEQKLALIGGNVKWLAEKGYIVQFFNGFLSPAASHPFFNVHGPKKAKSPSKPAGQKEPKPAEDADKTSSKPEQQSAQAAVEAEPAQEPQAEPAQAVEAETKENENA